MYNDEPFRLVGEIRYSEAEISAGAFACDNHVIAVGTYSGWALFDLDSLACQLSDPAVLPVSCCVSGVQFDGADLLLLGNQRHQSFGSPGDWNMQLLLSRGRQRPSPIHALPAGNWRMVRNAPGQQVYLYDVSEGAGVVCYEQRGLSWRLEMPAIGKIVADSDRLLCLEEQRLTVLRRSNGSVLLQKDLPATNEYRWTTVAGLKGEALVLGGYRIASKAFALAILDDKGKAVQGVLEHPLECVFTTETIDAATADECCGIDIFHIARILPLSAQTLVLGLGGDGEMLGACQGAAALAMVNLDKQQPWRSQVVDTYDGISGFTRLADGRYLVDLCGRLGVFAPVTWRSH